MTTPSPKLVWRRKLRPGAKIRVDTRIAHDGALCVNYHPSCVETFAVLLDP